MDRTVLDIARSKNRKHSRGLKILPDYINFKTREWLYAWDISYSFMLVDQSGFWVDQTGLALKIFEHF